MRRFPVAVAALALSGCAQNAIYWPAVANTQPLSKRGDLSVSLHGSPIQWQANGAYALTNHIELRAAGDYRLATDQASTWSAEGGAGWFFSDKQKEGWRGSIDVDAGGGSVNDLLSEPIYFVDNNGGSNVDTQYTRFRHDFTRVSLQGDAGYEFDTFSLVGALRGTRVDGTVTSRFHQAGGPNTESSEPSQWILVEPVVVIRARVRRHVSFEAQLGASLVTGGTVGPAATAGQLWPFIGAAGLAIDF